MDARRLVLGGPRAGRTAGAAFAVRLAAGAVFVAFGVGKFIHHADEVASFEDYGLPSPDATVYAIGVLEIAGEMRGDLLRQGLLGDIEQRRQGTTMVQADDEIIELQPSEHFAHRL